MKPHYLTSPTVWAIAAGCFCLTLILSALLIRIAPRIGAVDRGGHRGVHRGRAMPLLGGLAIAIPFVAICVLGFLRVSFMFSTIRHHQAGLLALAVGCIGICALGVADDIKGLSARAKFAVQFAMASLACLAGYSIRFVDLPIYGDVWIGPAVGTALTLLWIVGLTNAYNLMDGIDGLSAGLALIAAAGLACISLMNGSTFPALMCIALAASLAAFLLFNFHPARIFLGDTGSMFLGFALANITLMGSLKTSGAVMFIAPILVMGLPIMDTLSSMLRRYLRGRPLFYGDQGHIHHRLLKKGYTQTQAVLTFYGIAAAMTVSGIVGWAAPPHSPVAWLAYASYGLAAVAVIRIAGLRPGMIAQMMAYRKHNLLLNALSQYAAMRLEDLPGDGAGRDDNVLHLLCRELNLRFLMIKDEHARRVLAYAQSGEPTRPQEPIRRIPIRNADHRMLYLTYQPDRPIDEQARADVEGCLATVFEHTRFRANGEAQQPEPAPLIDIPPAA